VVWPFVETGRMVVAWYSCGMGIPGYGVLCLPRFFARVSTSLGVTVAKRSAGRWREVFQQQDRVGTLVENQLWVICFLSTNPVDECGYEC
jgi:hypothetical protein